MNALIVLACVLAAAAATSIGYTVKVHHPHGHSSISNGAHHSQTGYSHNSFAHTGYNSHTGHVSQHREIDPVAIAAGAPLPHGDTHDVAAAKSAHLHAHAAATARHHAAAVTAKPDHYSHDDHYSHGQAVAYNGYAHGGALLQSEPRIVVDSVAIHVGAPLPVGDTAEVAHAKALHFKAHAARGNLIGSGHGYHY